MLAARLHGKGDIRVERIPPPDGPGPHEVRMAVRAAGICGSDLHNLSHRTLDHAGAIDAGT